MLEQRGIVNACSENRRRLQQEGACRHGETLDDVMRREWNALSDRHKLVYFERAQKATEHKSDAHRNERGTSSVYVYTSTSCEE